MSAPPVYSGKYFSIGTFGSLFLKTSILFKNNMMEVLRNQRELMTDSNRISDSCIRFWFFSSNSTWSYSDNAVQKMMLVTDSKQCIHFFRSERWPPTSNIWMESCPMLNRVSVIPVVFARARSTSFSVGV